MPSTLRDPEPLRIGILIGQLGLGGAERQLLELVQRLDRREFHESIFVLSDELDPYGPVLESAGADIVPLPRLHSYELSRIWRLRRVVARYRTQVLHCYGYEAAAYGYFALMGRPSVRFLPSIRSVVVHPPWVKRQVYRRMFQRAARVITNSQRGAQFAAEHFALRPEKTQVIHNGLSFDEIARTARQGPPLRTELGVAADTPLIGFVGKDSWQKNVRRFVEVCRAVGAARPDAHYVVVGARLGPEDRVRFDIDDPRFHFLGLRSDAHRIIGDLDVFVLSSDTEGCPNVVLEAAGLGVPVVAGDVGDVRLLLTPGGEGGVVQDQSIDAYRDKVLDVLMNREHHRLRASRLAERIEAEFSVDAMVRKTADCYRGVLQV